MAAAVESSTIENLETAPVEVPEIKLFGRWSSDDVQVNDISLTDYIPVKEKFAKYLPHSAGRYQTKRFRKAQCPIVERLTCSMMMHGRNNGKKIMAMRIVKHSFEIIHLLTGEARMPMKIKTLVVIWLVIFIGSWAVYFKYSSYTELCREDACRAIINHAGKGRTFQCPICRQQVRLTRQGVEGLPVNHLVTGLCERLQNQATLSGETGEQPQSGNRCSFHPSEVLKVYLSDEKIFVADNGNMRIQVFTLHGTFVQQFPTVVSGEEKMKPWDVAMDGEGNLWVVGGTDFAHFAVQYNKQGRVLMKLDLPKAVWNRGVAVNTTWNQILITQSTGDQSTQGEILVFGPSRKIRGTVVQQQGMRWPRYITVGGKGNIIVSGHYSQCVHVHNGYGQFQFQFGGEGSGEGQLNEPRGICTDGADNIIVADYGNSSVEMFDKTGRFVKSITTDLNRPCAVAMATQGQLVVTDAGNNTVSIFHTY
uniref:FAM69 N-terminal domain-containing protein n=1 Tax=Branchiostoma floridae TaxID=7739 RepID=C3Y2R6_BRAFL|eukprot:XP_002609318.1 hypothetical protein BRAFLDRAFT_124722 [Branchiostoma floridae]